MTAGGCGGRGAVDEGDEAVGDEEVVRGGCGDARGVGGGGGGEDGGEDGGFHIVGERFSQGEVLNLWEVWRGCGSIALVTVESVRRLCGCRIIGLDRFSRKG